MKKMRDEFDVLLPSVDPLEGEMARELLEERGIPSMLHGPDFDTAELGLLAHNVTRHPGLLVPKGSRTRAREILVEAWGEEEVARVESNPV